jgi:two-component system probable response regulator PhcQ
MPPKVLFVDDEPQVTHALKRTLRKEHYVILTANSAREALEMLAHTAIDVIVADEHMPGMAGSDLLALVRHRHPRTRRIMLTGHASLEAAVRAINEGGISRFLTKPCKDTDLTCAIAQALHQQACCPEHASVAPHAPPASALRAELEQESPGITAVPRDASGAIVLDDADVDLALVMQAIERAVTAHREH